MIIGLVVGIVAIIFEASVFLAFYCSPVLKSCVCRFCLFICIMQIFFNDHGLEHEEADELTRFGPILVLLGSLVVKILMQMQ
jgi:hypothetical protein